MGSRTKLVCGVGVNDADYITQKFESMGEHPDGRRKQRVVWRCPFYRTWCSMLERCYSDKFQHRNPTYAGCSVCDEWLKFTVFKKWMESCDWEGKQLDKDLLEPGNKIYSPSTCVFLSKRLNSFLIDRGNDRGEYPIGASWNKANGNFSSSISIGNGKRKHLGFYPTAEEAHVRWLKEKLSLAQQLSDDLISSGGDERVARAIVARYENYGKSLPNNRGFENV